MRSPASSFNTFSKYGVPTYYLLPRIQYTAILLLRCPLSPYTLPVTILRLCRGTPRIPVPHDFLFHENYNQVDLGNYKAQKKLYVVTQM